MPIDPIALSVVIPTRRGWPAVEPALRAVMDQAAAAGAEIIVADASGLPEPIDLAPHVRWLRGPATASVFQLRSLAYRASRGEIVAVTEDHCRVAPDWCARHLAVHRGHPDAAAVGGSLRNGTGDHAIDWAAFLVTQIPFVTPLPNGPVARTTGPANLSMKRRALERLPDHEGFGTIELFDAPDLAVAGEVLLQMDEPVVWHDQSMGFAGTSVIEFHNGRTLGGFKRGRMDRRDWLRIAGVAILPAFRSLRTIRQAWAKDIPRRALLTSVPAVIWLQYCAGAGEFLGYLAGPGDSALQLR